MAPEVDASSSSPSTKDPHCMVVFDSCKVRLREEGGGLRVDGSRHDAALVIVVVLRRVTNKNKRTPGVKPNLLGLVGAGSVGNGGFHRVPN